MDKKLQTFIGIMIFYVLLSYLIFPIGFYYLMGKTLTNAGNGFIIGSLISIALWVSVGRNMVK